MKGKVVEWLIGGGVALILSAAARALPKPEVGGSKIYKFIHDFTHLLLANFDKVGLSK